MSQEPWKNDTEWQVKVRKVDSSLQAALAAQRREAAKKQPFWKRGTKPPINPAQSSDRRSPLEASY
jgi:hypothetical protein